MKRFGCFSEPRKVLFPRGFVLRTIVLGSDRRDYVIMDADPKADDFSLVSFQGYFKLVSGAHNGDSRWICVICGVGRNRNGENAPGRVRYALTGEGSMIIPIARGWCGEWSETIVIVKNAFLMLPGDTWKGNLIYLSDDAHVLTVDRQFEFLNIPPSECIETPNFLDNLPVCSVSQLSLASCM